MTLDKILNLKAFRLPLMKPKNKLFIEFLEDKFKLYIKNLKSNNIYQGYSNILYSKADLLYRIEYSVNMILSILRKQYKGERKNAITMFDEFMNKNETLLMFRSNAQFVLNSNLNYFRAKNNKNLLKRKKFFHPPFDKTESIKATRYAFEGYPNLYLSNSVVLAYLETRSKKLSEFQVVKFNNKNILNLLNFELDIIDSNLKVTNQKEFVQQVTINALLFPLFLACYTRLADENVVTPLEYLIPQLLNHWIRYPANSFDGIKFTSTRIISNKYKFKFYNVIIPPIKFKDKGYCKGLSTIFNMSNVCSWKKDISRINDYFKNSFNNKTIINADVIQIEWGNKTKEVKKYCKTPVGKMEYYLVNKEKSRIINFD